MTRNIQTPAPKDNTNFCGRWTATNRVGYDVRGKPHFECYSLLSLIITTLLYLFSSFDY
jgi:hypothetical protein